MRPVDLRCVFRWSVGGDRLWVAMLVAEGYVGISAGVVLPSGCRASYRWSTAVLTVFPPLTVDNVFDRRGVGRDALILLLAG